MVIAVLAVGVMQVIADQVVDVVAVRYRLVAAAGTVGVTRLVAVAVMIGGAALRVLGVGLKYVLIDVIAVGMVQMALMEIVEVVAVLDGGVTTAGTVHVRMVGMGEVLVHEPQSPHTPSKRQVAESKTQSQLRAAVFQARHARPAA